MKGLLERCLSLAADVFFGLLTLIPDTPPSRRGRRGHSMRHKYETPQHPLLGAAFVAIASAAIWFVAFSAMNFLGQDAGNGQENLIAHSIMQQFPYAVYFTIAVQVICQITGLLSGLIIAHYFATKNG